MSLLMFNDRMLNKQPRVSLGAAKPLTGRKESFSSMHLPSGHVSGPLPSLWLRGPRPPGMFTFHEPMGPMTQCSTWEGPRGPKVLNVSELDIQREPSLTANSEELLYEVNRGAEVSEEQALRCLDVLQSPD